MALEPITRQEKIIAGQDLTPITRMEKFLKNFGGSGGGGGAQPDLSQTDTTKPDYVKGVIRQESLPEGYPYKEQNLLTEFLPETQLTFYTTEDQPEVIYCDDVEVPNFGLKESTAYVLRIMWDGVAYDREVTIEQPYVYAVGNMALNNVATGESYPDTGEPFWIVISRMAGNRVSFFMLADSIGEHTVSISELTETIHQIAEEFLPALTSPNGTKYQLTVADDGTLSAVAVP